MAQSKPRDEKERREMELRLARVESTIAAIHDALVAEVRPGRRKERDEEAPDR